MCKFENCLWCEWKKQGRPMTFGLWQGWMRFFSGFAGVYTT